MFSRKTTLGFLIFIIVMYIAASAQAPDTLWTRHFGGSGRDEAWQLKQTSDGGFVIVGFTESGNPADSDIYLIKTDEHGDTLWTRAFDYSLDDVGRSVEPLDDGGYVIAGIANNQSILIKTDSLGNEIWHSYLDSGYGRAVRAAIDGGYIIAGYKPITGMSFQLYIGKIDNSGNLIWSKTYGGNEPEMAWDVQELSDGGFIVIGWTETYGIGSADIYLIKTNASGDSLWSRTYGNVGNDEARSILVKEDDGYIFAGKTMGYSAYIVSTDSNGDTIWTTFIEDVGESIANSIVSTFDGGYVVAGMRFGTLQSSFVAKLNANGGLLWSTIIEDPAQNLYCRSIIQTPDSGFVVAGYHQVPNNGNDIFLGKLSAEITGIDESEITLPDKLSLHQNYPNPFNASTTISFTLAEPEYVKLSVYDLLGSKVQVLADGILDAGDHNVIWNAEDHNSGIYFYHLKAGDISESKSMILLK